MTRSVLQPGTAYVIDGAMATELERRGADLRDPLWSARVLVEQPALIEAVHLDYFEAGADIALTASYQATFAGFATRGLDAASARRLLLSAVELARRARERFLAAGPLAPGRPAPLVGASIGPFGAHRHDGSEYHGDYGVPARTLIEFHRRQLDVLAAAGADFVAFETVPSLAEGEAILRLLEEFPEVPAWISFSCRNGAEVCHGEPFAECAALANERAQIIATGLNCTPPQHVASLLESARGRTRAPLFAYPNSGESWSAGSGSWCGAAEATPFAVAAAAWRDAGARLIGGCCRTTPADIRAVATLLRAGTGT
jgi:homocysteine S-methyltransferase